MEIYVVSACLLALKTRYDGKIIPGKIFREREGGKIYIPVCPEQLGGLPTPRVAADLVGGDGHDVLAGQARVMTRDGVDVTENFILGGRQVLAIARQQDIFKVLLKARSPSCGLAPKIGVTAALLQAEGYRIDEISI